MNESSRKRDLATEKVQGVTSWSSVARSSPYTSSTPPPTADLGSRSSTDWPSPISLNVLSIFFFQLSQFKLEKANTTVYTTKANSDTLCLLCDTQQATGNRQSLIYIYFPQMLLVIRLCSSALEIKDTQQDFASSLLFFSFLLRCHIIIVMINHPTSQRCVVFNLEKERQSCSQSDNFINRVYLCKV